MQTKTAVNQIDFCRVGIAFGMAALKALAVTHQSLESMRDALRFFHADGYTAADAEFHMIEFTILRDLLTTKISGRRGWLGG